jgi:hypothetical protein
MITSQIAPAGNLQYELPKWEGGVAHGNAQMDELKEATLTPELDISRLF